MVDKEMTEKAEARLKSLLDSINEANRVLAIDLSSIDPRTANGHLTRKREAEEELKHLTSAYKTLISNSVVRVFVSGPGASRFVEFCEKRDDLLTVDAKDMYASFAKDVEPTLDHKLRNWTSTQTALLVNSMQRYMEKHGIRILEAPKLDAGEMDPPMKTTEDVVERTRDAIRKSNGDNLTIVDVSARILEAAIDKKVAKVLVPAIVHGLSKDELQSLPSKMPPSIVVEVTDKKKNEDVVKEINKKISELINK